MGSPPHLSCNPTTTTPTPPPHLSCNPTTTPNRTPPPTPQPTPIPIIISPEPTPVPSEEPTTEPSSPPSTSPPHLSCNPTTIPVPSPGMVTGRTDPTLAVCGEPGAGSSLYEYICGLDDFKLMCYTIQRAGLKEMFEGVETNNVYTLYGVINSGMESCGLDKARIDTTSPDILKTFIEGHTMVGSIKDDELACNDYESTLAGSIQIGCPDNGVKTTYGFYNADIKPQLMSPSNISVCNGVIHIVDYCILIQNGHTP